MEPIFTEILRTAGLSVVLYDVLVRAIGGGPVDAQTLESEPLCHSYIPEHVGPCVECRGLGVLEIEVGGDANIACIACLRQTDYSQDVAKAVSDWNNGKIS